MTKEEILSIFKEYSVDEWKDWIDDVIHLDVAYPTSRLTPEGEPLVDILHLLGKNEISVKKYETAFAETFKKFADIDFSSPHLERILDVITEGQIYKANDALLKFFLNRDGDKGVFSSGASIKGIDR